MYNKNIIKCPACDYESENMALLNRHISKCEKYDEWIKTYKPQYFNCEKCNLTFLNTENLNNHNCKN